MLLLRPWVNKVVLIMTKHKSKGDHHILCKIRLYRDMVSLAEFDIDFKMIMSISYIGIIVVRPSLMT